LNSVQTAVTVVVVNVTTFHGGSASTDLGDNDRATAVTIFGINLTGRGR
jgi:hypothetical protein